MLFRLSTLKETFHSWPKLSSTTDIWNSPSNEQNLIKIIRSHRSYVLSKVTQMTAKQIALVRAGYKEPTTSALTLVSAHLLNIMISLNYSRKTVYGKQSGARPLMQRETTEHQF